MKITSVFSLVMAFVLATGCASVPKRSQQLDQGRTIAITGDCKFDLGRAMAVTGDNDTTVVIDGFSGKGSGAVVGGAAGAGTGLFFGTLSCIAVGPLFFAPCMGIVLPGTVAATAIGSAAAGAIVAESADGVEAKRSMLAEALSAPDASQRLVSLVAQKMLGVVTVGPLSTEDSSTTSNPEWTLRIAMTKLATVGSGPNTPYSLEATANLEVLRVGDVNPCFVKEYQAQNLLKLSTAEWQANNDEQVNAAVDGLLTKFATDMLNDLMPAEQTGGEVADYSKTSKALEGSDAKGEKNVGFASTESFTRQPKGQEYDSGGMPSLFDDRTGINWIIVPSSPVDLGTAKKMCGSIETDDLKKYKIPSLHEFEQLWKGYKDDGRMSIFNRKEYTTSDKDELTGFGYSKTFSFEYGTSGNLYAAYLVCASQ